MLNDRNKNFSRLVNKLFMCAIEFHSLLCTVGLIRTLTVIITLCSSYIPSVWTSYA